MYTSASLVSNSNCHSLCFTHHTSSAYPTPLCTRAMAFARPRVTAPPSPTRTYRSPTRTVSISKNGVGSHISVGESSYAVTTYQRQALRGRDDKVTVSPMRQQQQLPTIPSTSGAMKSIKRMELLKSDALLASVQQRRCSVDDGGWALGRQRSPSRLHTDPCPPHSLISLRSVSPPYDGSELNRSSSPLEANASHSSETKLEPCAPNSANGDPHDDGPTTSLVLFKSNQMFLSESRRRAHFKEVAEKATGIAALSFRGYLGSAHMSLVCYLCAESVDVHEFGFHLQRCQRHFDQKVRAIRMHPLCGHLRYPTPPVVEVDEEIETTNAVGDIITRKRAVVYTTPPNSTSSHTHRLAYNKVSAQCYATLTVLCRGCGHNYPVGDMQHHLSRCTRTHTTQFDHGGESSAGVSVSVNYPREGEPVYYARAISTLTERQHAGASCTASTDPTEALRGIHAADASERLLAIAMQPAAQPQSSWVPHLVRRPALGGGSAGAYLTTKLDPNSQIALTTNSMPNTNNRDSAASLNSSTFADERGRYLPQLPLGGTPTDSITRSSTRVMYSSRTTSPQRYRAIVRAPTSPSRQSKSPSKSVRLDTSVEVPQTNQAMTEAEEGATSRTISWKRAAPFADAPPEEIGRPIVPNFNSGSSCSHSTAAEIVSSVGNPPPRVWVQWPGSSHRGTSPVRATSPIKRAWR